LTATIDQEKVQPEKVLRELRDLWAELGKEQETAGGVLRACAMTLIVIAENEEDAELVRRTLGVLMHDHPSRAIVLRASEGAPLTARVFAECWMPFGRNQQICSEGIEMTADAANLGEVAQLLTPLVVPDLPVVLWCRGSHFFSSRYFDPLFPMVNKLIVDSTTAPNAKGALAVLKELRSRGQRIADLSWTRLTPWREALAHVFGTCPMQASQIRSARIEYGASLSTTVLYFARWIERAIPYTSVTMESTSGPPGLNKVTLSGEGIELSVRSDAGLLEVCATGGATRSPLPVSDHDSLMREELSILGRDPVFESVLI
jgi:glucose-6-phosphate dehydrogenase assembly protein OpcA